MHDDGVIEGQQGLLVTRVHDSMVELVTKEDLQGIVPCSTSATTLSADKLLETAIKDTCILSEDEDSDDSDSMDGLSDEQSACENEKVLL